MYNKRMDTIRKQTKKAAVTLVGLILILAGLIMLLTPGPGLLVIILGLSVLATEYVWANHLLSRAKDYYNQAKQKTLSKIKAQSNKRNSNNK